MDEGIFAMFAVSWLLYWFWLFFGMFALWLNLPPLLWDMRSCPWVCSIIDSGLTWVSLICLRCIVLFRFRTPFFLEKGSRRCGFPLSKHNSFYLNLAPTLYSPLQSQTVSSTSLNKKLELSVVGTSHKLWVYDLFLPHRKWNQKM